MKATEIDFDRLDALCEHHPARYPFLLESVNHNQDNRYSILFAHPGESICLNQLHEFDFLERLSKQLVSAPNIESELPFVGGYFVYLSYELAGQIEPILAKDLALSDAPIAIATWINSAIIVDHLTQTSYLLDIEDDVQRTEQILNDIEALPSSIEAPEALRVSPACEPDQKFLDGVSQVKRYIKAGDVFQVNLSRQWDVQLSAQCADAQLYQQLKQANPAPFSALAQFETFSIISSSPERLFSVDGETIQTRPIAGTHPRGSGEEDEALKQQLISHPKERSEHIMLLDLERNDLGRVCEYGSVVVDDVMFLETYPYVHHIVSNITGKLRKGVGVAEIVRALFPGGTITGCPKVRCMQIIAELEQMPRAAYTGSLGYISCNNKMDFNILIRTMTKRGEHLSFRAGAGIVFDSIAERELEETVHKAQGILKLFTQG